MYKYSTSTDNEWTWSDTFYIVMLIKKFTYIATN